MVNEILKLLFEAKIITAPNVESYKKKDICTIILSRELSGGLLAKYNTINSILNEDLLQIVTDEEIENSDYTIMNNYLSNNKCEHLVIIGLTISTTKYGVKYREQGRTYDNTHIFTTDYNLEIKEILNEENSLKIAYGWDYLTSFIGGLSHAIFDLCNYKLKNKERLYSIGNAQVFTTTNVIVYDGQVAKTYDNAQIFPANTDICCLDYISVENSEKVDSVMDNHYKVGNEIQYFYSIIHNWYNYYGKTLLVGNEVLWKPYLEYFNSGLSHNQIDNDIQYSDLSNFYLQRGLPNLKDIKPLDISGSGNNKISKYVKNSFYE